MARPISQLLDTLASTLSALREALTPTMSTANTPVRQNASRQSSPRAAKPAAASKGRRKAKTPSTRLAHMFKRRPATPLNVLQEAAKWSIADLITQRSQVQILPPQPMKSTG